MRGLERELLREKAAVLGRIAGMLESHLAELARLAAALETRPASAARDVRVELERVRQEALRWRWYLLVQREAIGQRDPRPVLEAFPIPPPR